jgi:hypothetical protein
MRVGSTQTFGSRPLDEIPVIDRPDGLEAEDILEVQPLRHGSMQILRPQRRLHETPIMNPKIVVERYVPCQKVPRRVKLRLQI